ncbi:MAG: THUMP domain-containing protein [Armatimonadota bacterium]
MARVHAAELLDTALFVTCACGFEADAMGRLRHLVPGAQTHRMFIRGTFLLTCDEQAADVIGRIRQNRTLHVSTATPVTVRAEISKHPDMIDDLAETAYRCLRLNPELSFRVSCRRRGDHRFGSPDVERRVGEVFYERDGLPVDLEEPEQIVSVEILQNTVYMGANPVGQMVDKDVLEKRKYPPGQRPINRSEWKLREALDEFGITITNSTRALDLGAAPGGWTRVLAENGASVIAVDPGELDERVLKFDTVSHAQMKADEFIDDYDGPTFDIITNDMNVDPEVSARMMVDFAGLVQTPEGLGLMTIKFVSTDREKHLQRVNDILSAAYGDFRVQTMPHNAMETTLLMRVREQS